MKILISIVIFSLLATSCGILSMKKPGDTVVFKKGCELDFNSIIEIERMSFKLPEFWSNFSNCNALIILDDTARGEWSINAMGVFGYKNVTGISGALGFDVGTRLDFIGRSWRSDPNDWMEWKKKQWEKQAKSKNAGPKERKVDRVERNGMDCWRIETKSFLRKQGTIKEYEQSNLGVYYQCWSEDRGTYPPIDLGAGITYRNGKSLYPDLDIDKDILSPVFETLKLKKIPRDKYEKRVEENIENYQKKCKENYNGYKKNIRKKRGLMNNNRVKYLITCGYDSSEIKSLRCNSLREDLLMVKEDFILMSNKQYFNKKEHTEVMLGCGYNDEEVEKFHNDACQISYQRAQDLNKNKSFKFDYYYINYLEKCGFLVDQFQ